MDLFGKSTRPTFNDTILDELSEEIAKSVHEWNNDVNEPFESTLEAVKDILSSASARNENGYDLAKRFEDKGFEPDPQLVEILDYVSYAEMQILDKYIQKWVIEDEIKPELPIESKILVKGNFFNPAMLEGIITGYREKTAEYLVCIPSKGQTIDGKTRSIIKYENAILKTEQQPITT